MRAIAEIIIPVLLVGCLHMAVAMAGGINCDGPYKGRRLIPEELTAVLRTHQAWSEAQGEPTNVGRAILCQAILTETDLQEAILHRADLRQADLSRANLQGAKLAVANLQEANLSGANLQGAGLYGANLQGATLIRTNLQEAS